MRLPLATKQGAMTYAQVDGRQDLADERWEMNDNLWQSIYTILNDEDLSPAERIAMAQLTAAQFSADLVAWVTSWVTGVDPDAGEQMSLPHLQHSRAQFLFDVFQATAPERKAGAVLSATNRATILGCIADLQALLDAAMSTSSASGPSHAATVPSAPSHAMVDHPASGPSHAADDEDKEEMALMAQLAAAMQPA